jgi:hypothetical protein
VSVEPSWQRKFRRAEHHFEQLTGLVQGFLSTDPYGAVEEIEDQPAGGVVHTWRGVIRDKPPPEWSPIIGDCLNNLRSSLDHMAWGLAGGRGDRTAFPIFSDQSEYRRVTPGRHLKYVRNDAHAFIESLQPYRHLKGASAHFLFLLDRLTNDDKHRELLGTEVGVAHIYIDNPVGQAAAGDLLTFEFEARNRWFENGAMFIRYRTSNSKMYVPLRFTFDVALDPEGPATGQPLLTCLGSVMLVVWMVLLAFEERFFPSGISHPIAPPFEGRAQYVGTDSTAERTEWGQLPSASDPEVVG